jgi:hypothetical protein
MPKNREPIPAAVRDKVLKEFSHRCAICGEDHPQVHHIDEDPANNDPMNLIPLCPNCHLGGQHNPAKPTEPLKLKLYRRYRDPIILKPQFNPLFVRVKFLDQIKEDTNTKEIEEKILELIVFIKHLEMGPFYSQKIMRLIGKQKRPQVFAHGSHRDPTIRVYGGETAEEYRARFRNARDEVYSLIVELLQFQRW